MSAGDDDQDALAAAWAAETEGGGGQDLAAEWAALVEDGSPAAAPAPHTIGAERILSQDEIDSLLGFSSDDGSDNLRNGVRAIINSALVSYERLPMLEVVFDRLVRVLTTSLRNFTSDNVEVSLDAITSIRFGDYLNSIPLPAMLGVFKAEQWDNFRVSIAHNVWRLTTPTQHYARS